VNQHTLPNVHNYQGGLINLPHTFRATGIITYLNNGGELETAQHVAGDACVGTRRMHNHRDQ